MVLGGAGFGGVSRPESHCITCHASEQRPDDRPDKPWSSDGREPGSRSKSKSTSWSDEKGFC